MTPEEQDYQDYQEYLAYQASQQPEARLDESYLGRFKNNLVSAADAASFGIADEGAALVRSLLPGYASYDEELAAIRGGMKDYAEVHPYQALASAVLGGLASAPATPAILTSAKAPTFARAVGSGAATGGLYGGLYGYGSGEGGIGNRLTNAATSAGVGAVGGATLGGATYAGAQAVQRLASGLSDGPGTLSSEAGFAAIGKPTMADSGLSPEQKFIARRLRNMTEGDISEGQQAMELAVQEGSPMFLPESLPKGSSNLNRLVRFLAGNEASMDDVSRAVEGRKAGALDRVTNILDDISTERSPVVAGQKTQTAIGEIGKELAEARAEKAAPLYNQLREGGGGSVGEEAKGLSDKLFGPPQKGYKLEDAKGSLLDDPVVKDAIGTVRKYFRQHRDKPDNHFSVLDEVKRILDDKAETAVARGDKTKGKAIRDLRTQIVDMMDKQTPLYKTARAIFEEGSTDINTLFDERGAPLATLARQKPERVGATLLGLDKDRITQIKDVFGEKRGKALVDVARATLQGDIEKVKRGRNLVTDIVDSQAMRDKLRIIIGDEDKASNLFRLLDREDRYARAANTYNPGSTTHGNFAEEKGFANSAKKLLAAVGDPVTATLDYIGQRSFSDDLARKLASVLTDPQAGADFYQAAIPYLNEQRRIAARSEAVSRPLGVFGGVSGAITETD